MTGRSTHGTAYARTRTPEFIGDLRPELVALRLKMLDGEVERFDAREREIKEAERRGRLTRPYGPQDKW